MKLKVIKTKKKYEDALEWVENAFDLREHRTSNKGKDLQEMLLLIKKYEDEHFPIPMPDIERKVFT